MKIIHFSDIHEGAFPAPSSFFSKRLFGGSNYVFRRKKTVDWNRLDLLTAFVKQEKFDYVIISGDFTSTGSAREFEMVKKRLQDLHDIEGVKILAVPGNHDNYIDCQNNNWGLSSQFSDYYKTIYKNPYGALNGSWNHSTYFVDVNQIPTSCKANEVGYSFLTAYNDPGGYFKFGTCYEEGLAPWYDEIQSLNQ